MKQGQDEYLEQDLDANTNGSVRPSRLRKDKRGTTARSRAMHRKGNTQGGIHERGNKKANW